MLWTLASQAIDAFYGFFLSLPLWVFAVMLTVAGAFIILSIATDTHFRWRLLGLGLGNIVAWEWQLLWMQQKVSAFSQWQALQMFAYGLVTVPVLSVLLGLAARRYAREHANVLAVAVMSDAQAAKERERRGLPDSAPLGLEGTSVLDDLDDE